MRSALAAIALAGVVIPMIMIGSAARAEPAATTPPPSSYVGTIEIDRGGTLVTESTGDLWPSCWAGNDNLYTANGDGRGFSLDIPANDIVMNEVTGGPSELAGRAVARADQLGTIWNPTGYNRKPTGMFCVGDTLYLAVQDLAKDFNDAPAATIAKSTDHGRTWTWDKRAPMFDDHTFTTIWFADFGRGNTDAPDRFAYAYGLDGNWRDSATDEVPDPQDVFLARIPVDRSKIVNPGASTPAPTSTAGRPGPRGSNRKRPVLTDTRRLYQQRYGTARGDLTVISQGGVTYLPRSKRYLYASWTGPTFELYESPQPWGPWRHITSRDFGGTPWSDEKHGGYATTIPSKFISDDERSLYLQSNVFCCGELKSRYNFNLRRLSLVPADPSPADNLPEPGQSGHRSRHGRDLEVLLDRPTGPAERRRSRDERERLRRRGEAVRLVGLHLAADSSGSTGSSSPPAQVTATAAGSTAGRGCNIAVTAHGSTSPANPRHRPIRATPRPAASPRTP